MREGGGRSSLDDLPSEVRWEIERLIHERSLIEAIRLYRQHTGGTLRESRDVVAGIAAGMGIETGRTGRGLSCWLLGAGFLAWMGLIASMPFLAKLVLTRIWGEGLSPGLVETVQALAPILLAFLSVAILFTWAVRRKRG